MRNILRRDKTLCEARELDEPLRRVSTDDGLRCEEDGAGGLRPDGGISPLLRRIPGITHYKDRKRVSIISLRNRLQSTVVS